MVEKIGVENMLAARSESVVFDVRTPSEFEEGHVPGAVNLPLFSDDERAHIGTLYKQKGPDHALMEGLAIVGPRMKSMAKDAAVKADGRDIIVHCWRGGKRSESVGWLLDFAGLNVKVVEGGYKAYRRYCAGTLDLFNMKLIVLGGRTGSRKTEILKALASAGEQVIDLESLANHKGSAFGWIGEEPQPSTQQFENKLFDEVVKLDHSRRIWVENESKSIGRVYLPDRFWKRMKAAPLVHLDVPLDIRIDHLVSLYAADNNQEELRQSFQKIRKRLGGQHLNAAIEALETQDLHKAAEVALVYYDKTYDYNLSVNEAPVIHVVEGKRKSIQETAAYLIDFVERNI